MNNNRCLYCQQIIPEGRDICPACEESPATETKASNRLLNLEFHRLMVWRTLKKDICVAYEDCEVKEGNVLCCVFGEGLTFEQACEDYLSKISGKLLVFNQFKDNKTKAKVIVL